MCVLTESSRSHIQGHILSKYALSSLMCHMLFLQHVGKQPYVRSTRVVLCPDKHKWIISLSWVSSHRLMRTKIGFEAMLHTLTEHNSLSFSSCRLKHFLYTSRGTKSLNKYTQVLKYSFNALAHAHFYFGSVYFYSTTFQRRPLYFLLVTDT